MVYAGECFIDLGTFLCFVSAGDFSGYYTVSECSFSPIICGLNIGVLHELEQIVFLFEEVFYEFPAFGGFVRFLGECCFHVLVKFFDVFVRPFVIKIEGLLVCVFQDFMDSLSIIPVELSEFFGIADDMCPAVLLGSLGLFGQCFVDRVSVVDVNAFRFFAQDPQGDFMTAGCCNLVQCFASGDECP